MKFSDGWTRARLVSARLKPPGVFSDAKGAPGTILSRCSSYWQAGERAPLDDARRRAIKAAVEQLERDGMYLLAAARKDVASTDSPDSIEREMTFIGLQAMMDPPRPEAAGAR